MKNSAAGKSVKEKGEGGQMSKPENGNLPHNEPNVASAHTIQNSTALLLDFFVAATKMRTVTKISALAAVHNDDKNRGTLKVYRIADTTDFVSTFNKAMEPEPKLITMSFSIHNEPAILTARREDSFVEYELKHHSSVVDAKSFLCEVEQMALGAGQCS